MRRELAVNYSGIRTWAWTEPSPSMPGVRIGAWQSPPPLSQASEAERIVFELLRGVRAPGLGLLFFHGRHYAGRTAKHTSGRNLITREHDYVVLVRYYGERLRGLCITFRVAASLVPNTWPSRWEAADCPFPSPGTVRGTKGLCPPYAPDKWGTILVGLVF